MALSSPHLSRVQVAAWTALLLGAVGFLHEVFWGHPVERPFLLIVSFSMVTGSFLLPNGLTLPGLPQLPTPPTPPPQTKDPP